MYKNNEINEKSVSMKRTTILGLMIILLPQIILANAGTALMWVSMIHLLFGNLLLGLMEGFILKVAFKAKIPRAFLIMILANYLSWIVGHFLIVGFQNILVDIMFDLEHVYQAWIASMILLYFITVLIETPFVIWVYKNKINLKKSLFYSVIINIITYLGMIILYLVSSEFSIFTDLDINQSLLDNRSEKHVFYMISDNKIYTYNLINKKKQLLMSLKSNYKHPIFKLNSTNDSLIMSLDVEDAGVEQNNAQRVVIDSKFCSVMDAAYYANFQHPRIKPAEDFRDINNRTWEIFAGPWASQGLSIVKENKKNKTYAFEVPWMMWAISNVVILNNHEVIFKLNNRLVLLDIRKKEIAFIDRAVAFYIKRIPNRKINKDEEDI